jgi:polar amino acid transport system permease protein
MNIDASGMMGRPFVRWALLFLAGWAIFGSIGLAPLSDLWSPPPPEEAEQSRLVAQWATAAFYAALVTLVIWLLVRLEILTWFMNLVMEHPLVRWILLFIVAFLGFLWAGQDLLHAIGFAAALTVNIWIISLFRFPIQVGIAWLELFTLFMLFFYSFHLSYDYIFDRGRFLLGLGLRNGFLMGAALTVYICIVAITISTILALFAALGRLSNNGFAYGVSTFYTSFFRGTPLLLQILLIYLGLPQIGVILTPIPSAIIALSLCYGAYGAEIFRAGILGVPGGQREAARALGLHEGTIMRLIVLPQAMKLIVPPMGNQFIAMLKDSSLVSVLGAWELMYMARTHGRAEFKYMEMLIAAALIYWALSFCFEMIQTRIEAYYGKGDKR